MNTNEVLNKLIAEIERRIANGQDGYGGNLKALLLFIASLQQEQPDAYEDAMLEVKGYVDKLHDNASIGLNEYDSGLYNGIAETCMKLRGFIKARTAKEQPEVDLDKEIDRLWESFSEEMSGPHNLFDMYRRLARHFYEIGLNAIKEK